MFRPMLRSRQQISAQECIDILKNEPRGVLSVLGDEGYPYGVPINQYYCEADGKLYIIATLNYGTFVRRGAVLYTVDLGKV